jgi:hypothetical protein
MFGVWLTRDPYAPMAWAAWSSDMMKMMFGRSAVNDDDGKATRTPTMAAAMNKGRMVIAGILLPLPARASRFPFRAVE